MALVGRRATLEIALEAGLQENLRPGDGGRWAGLLAHRLRRGRQVLKGYVLAVEVGRRMG